MKRAFALLAILALIPVVVDAHNAFERAILARSDVTHFWELRDTPQPNGVTPGPCPTGAGHIFDSIADGATALPSPVPLAVETANAGPVPNCATAPIYLGGGPSITVCPAVQQSAIGGCLNAPFIEIVQAAFPSKPFSFFCIMDLRSGTKVGPTYWTYAQGSTNQLRLFGGSGTANSQQLDINGGVHSTSVTNNKKMFWVVTVGSVATSLYVNGAPVISPTVLPSPLATVGAIGAQQAASGGSGGGVNAAFSDCGEANTEWTLSTVQYLWSILDQNGSF